VALKGVEYLKKIGIADVCNIGTESEFFIFDEIRNEQKQFTGFYQIDSVEGDWNTRRIEEPNLGYKPSDKRGYFSVRPTDTYPDLRDDMVLEMPPVDIEIEEHLVEDNGSGAHTHFSPWKNDFNLFAGEG